VLVIDNDNNQIRGGRVERDAGGDEKQLIKFAWLNIEVKDCGVERDVGGDEKQSSLPDNYIT